MAAGFLPRQVTMDQGSDYLQRKIYQLHRESDESAARSDYIRVIDNEGEDYL